MPVIENDDDLRPEKVDLENQEWDSRPEFQLNPVKKKQKVAMVHGAVNNCRTNVLLDSGATVSMLRMDLARRLKLNLTHGKPLRVTGLGGIPTIITARTEVKITLSPRVVYVIELWVANIGEGVDEFDFVFEKDSSNFRTKRTSFWQEQDPFGKLMAWTYLYARTNRYISDPENNPLSEFTMGRTTLKEKW
ncbi:hypothetical protein PHMEG_00013371 [Phytophthora megakarya]|uniref:Peptidase A2 domain-containing protein n=1 Tax=Phytophthora megakarya TaxID=4795 RepID=A0A225W6E9_9STRA|nr:hypothetical protein PHMEG_00013371 [Phytophthora megakarya]